MTTIETNKKSSELMQVTDIKDVSKVDLGGAKEVVDQIETGGIKEKLKNMEEKIRPYKGISKDLSTLQDFIYKQSGGKRNLGNKEGTISYKNNKGEDCLLAMSTRFYGYPLKESRSISIKEGDKFLKLNWGISKITDGDGRGSSEHYYLTDEKDEIIADWLSPEQVKKQVEYIKSKKTIYEESLNAKIDNYRN